MKGTGVETLLLLFCCQLDVGDQYIMNGFMNCC